ncbi:oligosaccharide flippase family protein [Mycobacterium adipatum]|nr:oligosaccharide flippase family protein [Mycobacterium adipatum]
MLVTQILLANSLGVIDRGTVAAATAPLLLAVALLTLGLPESLTHFVAQAGAGRLTRQFLISLIALGVSGTIGMLAIVVVARPLSAGDNHLAGLIVIASAALVPALLTAALRGVAYGAHQWWLVMIERTLSAVLQLSAVGALFINGWLTPTTATVAIATTTFAGAVVYLLAPRWWTAIRGTTTSSQPTPSLHRVVSYAWQLWVGSSAGVVLSRLDQVMMTPLAGVDQLGVYVVAVNVSNVALLFNSAVSQVMFAVESGAPSTARIGRAARISTLATALVAVTLAAASPWMIPLLFGREFAPAAPIVAVLLLSIMLGIPGSVAGAALSARGRPGLRSLALTIAMVLYIVAMFLLVPPYGALGAAFAMLAGTTAPYLCIYWLHRHCGVPLAEFYQFRASDLDVFRRRSD